MRAVPHIKGEYKQKIRIVRAKDSLEKMDKNDAELERGIKTVE